MTAALSDIFLSVLPGEIHAIVGENGAGKSTTLSALSFCFYGKTDRDLNKSEIINNINNKELYTSSTLSINGKIYKIAKWYDIPRRNKLRKRKN